MMKRAEERSGSVYRFFVLACLITWGLALPTALAWMRKETPSPLAMAGAGLSAFGPLLAALHVGRQEGRLGEVFGRWRTRAGWVALGLAIPLGLRALAVVLYAGVGGAPSRWFYPPQTEVQIMALLLFPVTEEFGWRGLAHGKLVRAHGMLVGSLGVGVMWGLWHLGYSISPVSGAFATFTFVEGMIELPLYSVILAWVFERSGRSMAVAIAFHAAAHLNHIELAPQQSELGLHGMHILVVGAAAVFVGWRLLPRLSASPAR